MQKSIPILVTEAAVREDMFRDKVHLWFNDGDPENYDQLAQSAQSLGSKPSDTSHLSATRLSMLNGPRN
jgi:hypothetical protein